MKLFFILPLFFFFLHAEITYDDAYFEYKKGEYKKSLKMFKKLAQKEQDYDAAYILGYMYEHGEGCSVDLEKSHKWYEYSSHGYYSKGKRDPSRSIDKEHSRLYKTIDELGDKETQMTIRQYAEGLYNVKAYKANYFLPVSYRINGEYADVNEHTAKNIETEFQVSLKYDFASNILGFHGIYTAAYTQKSYWQLYEESAYFRETNYNPELFAVFPLLGKGYFKYIKAFRFSLAHQSNGRGGEYERSWNYATAGAYFQTGLLFTKFTFWYRLKDNIDYNPDLLDYLGNGSVRFMVPYKDNLFKLKLRNVFSGRRAIKFTYTYPITRSNDLFLYVKAFSGYGESLIDYNHDIQKIGIGFSISR